MNYLRYINTWCEAVFPDGGCDKHVPLITGIAGTTLSVFIVAYLVRTLIELYIRYDEYKQRQLPPGYRSYKLASDVVRNISWDVYGSYQISNSFDHLVETYEQLEPIAASRLRQCRDNYLNILRLASETDKLLDSIFVGNAKAT